MEYSVWEKTVPATIANDALWRIKVYRLALFVADVGWQDVTKLIGDNRTIALADQLYRALGSIGANIAEGFGRNSGCDRVRYYKYAFGSARESRDWYYKARQVLGEQIVLARFETLSQIIRLLITMVTEQRSKTISEEETIYEILHEQNNDS